MMAVLSISEDVCAALGQSGRLGYLYDAHSHRVLRKSILKSKDIPAEALEVDDTPGLNYRYARSDNLTDRLSILDMTADLSLSVASGLIKADLAANYVCKSQSKAHARHVSTNCERKTKLETLLVDRLTVEHLNTDAIRSTGATHVITGIKWGSQTIVTAKITTTELDEKQHFGGKPSEDYDADQARKESKGKEKQDKTVQPVGKKDSEPETKTEDKSEDKSEDKKDQNQGKSRMMDVSLEGSNPLAKMLSKFSDIKLGGDYRSTDTTKDRTENIEFEIVTDIADHSSGSLPTTYAGVLDFLETTPSRLGDLNGGKGVPLYFHLQPIGEVAQAFKIQLQHEIILKRLEKSDVDRIVSALDMMENRTRELNRYEEIAKKNAFCLPKDHIKMARKQAIQARDSENKVKQNLGPIILDIRRGHRDSKDALNLFQKEDSDDSDSDLQPMTMSGFSSKIEFATDAVARGAVYIKDGDGRLQDEVAKQGQLDLFVLEYAHTSKLYEDWPLYRQCVDQLLEEQNVQHKVLVLDHDVFTTVPHARPVLKQYRGGKCIVDDVIGNMKELAKSCLVKCDDIRKVDRTRTKQVPAGRRVVRLKCPGPNCFDGDKSKWICATCHELVEYGFSDNDFYCRCSRYPSSSAVFKCCNAIHGPQWTKPENKYLALQLRELPDRQEYNILLLGKTGSGKSTFINAFRNYIDFDSLEEALSEQAGPLRYLIPGAFKFTEERLVHDELADKYVPGGWTGGGSLTAWRNSRIHHDIKIGKETKAERFPTGGRSATRCSQIYSFAIGDVVLRFIDTPGMGDTDGFDQDRKNVKDILHTLESVHKLSAVLFLLEAGDSKTTTEFKFCMTELLSQLHIDATKNILFAYTKAVGTMWGHGDASDAVASVINELGTNIILNQDNQFDFDSAAYRYLAACKYKGQRLAAYTDYVAIWDRSADSAFRLVKAVEELTVHEVQKTLCYNRVRALLENMAKPLTEFALCMQESKTRCEQKQEQLEKIGTQTKDYGAKLSELKSDRVTPVRHDLEKARVICSHKDCDLEVACHDGCDIQVPDDDRPNQKLEGCYAFRKALVFHYGECYRCKHDWTHHMRRSYYFTQEVEPLDEKSISHYTCLLDDGMSKEEVHKLAVKEASDYHDAICKEEEHLKTVQAKLGHYVGNSAAAPRIANHRDATVKYLQLRISLAKTDAEAERLEWQKLELEEKMKNLEQAVIQGVAGAPDEKDIHAALESLHEMKIFGACLKNALNSDPVQLEDRTIIHVSTRRAPSQILAKWTWKSIKSSKKRQQQD